jgi:GNAT superfamily N-acetyltransferase
MFDRPKQHVPPPVDEVHVVRARRPTPAFCRFLNNTVGAEYNWVDRKLMSDERLRSIVHDDRVEIHVLYVDGTPAGFVELDRRVDGQVELSYFGIMPEFIGKGLGKYFLDWAVDTAWSYNPRRVWVHTCDLDHEAALPLYLKAGFTIYDERVIDQVVP